MGGAGEVRGAVEWAEVRALAADGVSQRQIAARLGSIRGPSSGCSMRRSGRGIRGWHGPLRGVDGSLISLLAGREPASAGEAPSARHQRMGRSSDREDR
jgi:hypothetical protein